LGARSGVVKEFGEQTVVDMERVGEEQEDISRK
jgi:hypothetical protein